MQLKDYKTEGNPVKALFICEKSLTGHAEGQVASNKTFFIEM